jgi:hypothetical protein
MHKVDLYFSPFCGLKEAKCAVIDIDVLTYGGSK